MSDTPTARCVRESDGYHVHRHLITSHPAGQSPRPAVIELHLHSWMDEHRETHPNAKDVSAHRWLGLDIEPLGEYDTVEQAWKALGSSGDSPPVTCDAVKEN